MMNVQAGEEVILYTGAVSLPRLSKVKRVTPTGRVVLHDYHTAFYADGRLVGGGFHTMTRIEEATPENREKMERERERRRRAYYADRVRMALQMRTQSMTLEEQEALLTYLGVPLPEGMSE